MTYNFIKKFNLLIYKLIVYINNNNDNDITYTLVIYKYYELSCI